VSSWGKLPIKTEVRAKAESRLRKMLLLNGKLSNLGVLSATDYEILFSIIPKDFVTLTKTATDKMMDDVINLSRSGMTQTLGKYEIPADERLLSPVRGR
jgi:hypothetical protein